MEGLKDRRLGWGRAKLFEKPGLRGLLELL